MVQVVFAVFPLVQSMASNADSLVLFDFARDLINGKALQLWNLPRAPYLFPDTVLATALISLGWYGAYSIHAIACINYLLMVLVVHAVLVRSSPSQALPIWQTSVFVSAALLIISLAFPFAMVNIYWQLFASGAHFLTALVVLCILMLLNRWQTSPSLGLWLLIFTVTLLEALSDSMAALLLFAWIGQQLLGRLFLSKSVDRRLSTGASRFSVGAFLRQSIDLLTVLLAVIVGTLLGALLPRQSLLESFFSLDKFVTAVQLFGRWTIDSPSHSIFIALIIVGTIVYPLLWLAPQPRAHANQSANAPSNLSRNRVTSASTLYNWLRSPVVLPSFALIASTPLFYQELGSLRYLAFPALLLLICTSALLIQLAHLVRRSSLPMAIIIALIALAAIAALVYSDIRGGLIGKQQMTTGRDAVGLAVGADASGALACIEQTKQFYPLADGVATYWNARPIRFASQFDFYLAQINPWRPRAGYFLWGNNGADFVYRDAKSIAQQSSSSFAQNDTNKIAIRTYNFVIATQAEKQSRLWGSLPMQATQVVECKNHTLYYFENPAVLWQYLFPLGLPAPLSNAIALAAPVKELAQDLTKDLAKDLAKDSTKQSTKESSTTATTYWPDDLFTQVGVQTSSAISTNAKPGFLVYGPYLSLPAGNYRLQVLGHLGFATKPVDASKQATIGILDISAQFGTKIIASMALQESASKIAQLDFQLERDTHDVEFRIQVGANVQGQVSAYRLERLANDPTNTQ